jgi:hypothetical protein
MIRRMHLDGLRLQQALENEVGLRLPGCKTCLLPEDLLRSRRKVLPRTRRSNKELGNSFSSLNSSISMRSSLASSSIISSPPSSCSSLANSSNISNSLPSNISSISNSQVGLSSFSNSISSNPHLLLQLPSNSTTSLSQAHKKDVCMPIIKKKREKFHFFAFP